MYKRLVLFITCCICSFSLQAQSVTGRLLDDRSAGLVAVTVTLHGWKDSTLIKAAITDHNGVFQFEHIAEGVYFIRTGALGYEKFSSEVIQVHGDVSLPPVVLHIKTHDLKEVGVTAQQPLIVRKFDKLIVNVENSIIGSGNNALEVLQKSPGVMVDPNGNIQLKGKDQVLVMIDNKVTHLSQSQLTSLLRSMRSESIAQLEIISNPSARYDAAGTAGIINIKMKKNTAEGMNGSVYAGYGQGRYAQGNGGVNLNYHKGIVNLYGSYGRSQEQSWSRLQMKQTYASAGVIMTRDANGVYNYFSQNGKAGVDVQLNKKSSIGLMVSGNFSTNKTLRYNSPVYFQNYLHKMDSAALFHSVGSSATHTMVYDLSYHVQLDSSGQDLRISADYSKIDMPETQEFATDFFDAGGNVSRPAEQRRSNKPVKAEIQSAKIDYVHPFAHKATLELGAKVSRVKTDNDVRYEELVNGDWQNDTRLTNYFIYKEQINAGYLNFNKEFKKGWSVQLGVRAEQTIADARQVTIDSNVHRNYIGFFPSGLIDKRLNDAHDITFSYSRRIARPSYENLNPFVYYVDQYTYLLGNAYLKPQYTNSFELGHSYKEELYTTISYTHTAGVMTTVVYQNDTSRISYQTLQNLSSQDYWGLDVSYDFEVAKWWSVSATGDLFTNIYKGNINGTALDAGKWTVYLYCNNVITLPWKVKMEVSGFYQSGTQSGAFVALPNYSVTGGLQKGILHGRGNVKVTVNDVFNTVRSRSHQELNGVYAEYNNKQQSRRVNINFSYSFGNRKLQTSKRRGAVIEEEIRRAQ